MRGKQGSKVARVQDSSTLATAHARFGVENRKPECSRCVKWRFWSRGGVGEQRKEQSSEQSSVTFSSIIQHPCSFASVAATPSRETLLTFALRVPSNLLSVCILDV